MSYPDYYRHHHHHHPHHSLPSTPRQRPSDSGPPRRSFEYGSGPINIMPRPQQSSRNASGAAYHLSPQFYSHQPVPSPTSRNGHAHAHFEPYSQLPPSLSSSPQSHYQPRQSPQSQHHTLHPSSAAVSPMPILPSSGQRSRSSSQASGMERHSGESRRSRGSSRSRSRHHTHDRPHHHHRHSHHSDDSIDALERDMKNAEHRPTLGDSVFAAFNGMKRLVTTRRN